MNTKFGNIGNTKKGWNVLLRSAAWKLKSASDAVALEVIIPKVNRKTLDQGRQVPYSWSLSLLTRLTVILVKDDLEVTTTIGLVKMTNVLKGASAAPPPLGQLPLMCT
jgi:hypothetical protein